MTTPSNTFYLVQKMLQGLPTGLTYWQLIEQLNRNYFASFRFGGFSAKGAGYSAATAVDNPRPCCSMKELEDTDLIRKYHDTQDSAYMGELYQRYAHLVLGTCIKYLKDESRAQDAVSEIFAKLVVKLRKFHPNYFPGWLYKVSRNHCLEILRKDQTMPNFEHFESVQEVENLAETEAPEYLRRELVANEMSQAISKLPEKQRVSIELFYLGGLSYKQVAHKTGFSLKEIKSYVQNGKRNLRKQLSSAASEYGWKKSI